MALPSGLETVTGARELCDWFGYWPDFHDAEVIQFRFDLSGPCSLVAHTWEMTNQVDAKGYYELIKHVVVEFTMEEVSSLNLHDPWNHSVLLDLGLNKTETGFRLSFSAAYGLTGTIDAKELSLRIVRGKPSPDV